MHLRAGVKNINLQTRRGNCRLAWDRAGDPGSQVQIFASALSESLVWSLARTVPGLLASPLDRALKHDHIPLLPDHDEISIH